MSSYMRKRISYWEERFYRNGVGPPGVAALATGLFLVLIDFVLQRFPRIKEVEPPSSLAAGIIGLVGLITLFISLLYQGRFQRAEEIVRAVLVSPPAPHPRIVPDPLSLKNRSRRVHTRSSQLVLLLREYYRLFGRTPDIIGVSTYVTGLFLVLWLMVESIQIAALGVSLTRVGPLLLMMIVAEGALRLYWQVYRVAMFGELADKTTDDPAIGLGGWRRLLDLDFWSSRERRISEWMNELEIYLRLLMTGSPELNFSYSRRKSRIRHAW